MSCCCFGARKKGNDLGYHDTRDTGGDSIASTKNFSFNELRLATSNFHQINKIGRGGFGTVYKGTLKQGKEIAVKTLAAESRQGLREFLTEIETISNVKHPNLVEIIGCCADGNHRILVYEYLENRSLDRALFGSRTSIKLEWDKRTTICLGTARGLAYLHEELVPHIVHRDIKASNILLDKDYTPKIGDFGLAKLFPDNITHISTKIAGTAGYLAPEYVLGGQLTMKADVYSFGVLILEAVSGKSSSSRIWQGDKRSLLEWSWRLYQEEKLLELVDEELDDFPEKEVIRYIKTALFCTQANANRRPMMSQVIEMLSRDIQLNEKELTPPGLLEDSEESMQSKLKTSGCNTSQQSSVHITITQVTPR
ncbi:hypothetical protein R3W88_005725 [Solanum pinnatisectum]|uniref:Protein kinase domain-containing protein n=1 Tax=Solanum pinnatisectum TaxID=50273 RepID=A0AAV9KDD3_9SOLN|nr:hypothetical protein R3W88_005725 [Solanum pinnatisectum]